MKTRDDIRLDLRNQVGNIYAAHYQGTLVSERQAYRECLHYLEHVLLDSLTAQGPCNGCAHRDKTIEDQRDILQRRSPLANTDISALYRLYAFACGLNLQDHPRAEQREHLEIVRALGKLLGDDK